MKRTVQHILGVTVALAMTVSGALADPPYVIDHLPFNIDVPGDYHVQLPPDAPPVTSDYAIYITASDVNLDLNDQTITCANGIYVTNAAVGGGTGKVSIDHITIKNGTINGVVPEGTPPVGIWINGAVSHVSVQEMIFSGATTGRPDLDGFCNNVDNGSYDSFKNCTFRGALWLNNGDHGTFMNLTLAGNAFYVGRGIPVLTSVNGPNSFKNITILSGNVQLGVNNGDTYKNIFYQAPSTVTGGIPVK